MKIFIFGAFVGAVMISLFSYAYINYKEYVLAPVAAVSALYVLDKLKKRNHEKKINLTEKTSKKTVKRLASQTIAAVTLGTTAVVGLATSYAVVDHCEELKDIYEVDNLLNGDAKEFSFEYCIQMMQESTQEWMSIATENSLVQTKKITDDVKRKALDFIDKLPKFEMPSFGSKIE